MKFEDILPLIKAGKKKPIRFVCYSCLFSDGEYAIFLFYPNGVWDESKRTIKEALRAYPIEEYEWLPLDD